MSFEEHGQLKSQITQQYQQSLARFCINMEKKYPQIILSPTQSSPIECTMAFHKNFEYYHTMAVSGLMDGQRSLDSHKLAAISIVSVMKSPPMRAFQDGNYRDDHYVNETFAILLAHDIMLNARKHDYMEKDPTCEPIVSEILWRSPFPEAIYDNKKSPLHRFRFIIAKMNLSEEHFLQNVRYLAYICYQLDVYQRMLIEGNDAYDGKKST